MGRRTQLKTLLRVKQKSKCCYCEKTMIFDKKITNHPRKATLEHLLQRSKGGSDLADNMALACHSCNSGRRDTDWMTYKSMKLGETAYL